MGVGSSPLFLLAAQLAAVEALPCVVCRTDARKICIVSSEKWIAEKVERLVEPAIEAMGFELVRIRLTGDQRRVLQVMAEPHASPTMTGR